MRTLTLILALPVRLEHALDALRRAAPSLGALLARGAPVTAEASLSGLCCQALGVARQQDWPVAPLTARADGLAPEDGYWLRLDPAHLEVGMGGLMLRPAAELALAPDEAQLLAASLGDLGLDLRAPVPTRWYLRLPEPPALTTRPLDQVAGEYLSGHLPGGRDASRLMARVNEAQMLLHDHPVNLAREARGLPPVNGLWLWGGGWVPDPLRPDVTLAADNPEVRALAAGAGATPASVPPRLVDFVGHSRSRGLAVLAPEAADGGLSGHFARLEGDWFKPLLRRLQSGQMRRLDLHLLARPGLSVALDSQGAWRLWRRSG